MRPSKLSPEAIEQGLTRVPTWRLEAGCLQREYQFEDFDQAFGFMTRLAEVARRLDHHPDWSNSYGRVQIALCTHDVGGLTHLDFELARAAEACFEAL